MTEEQDQTGHDLAERKCTVFDALVCVIAIIADIHRHRSVTAVGGLMQA